MRWTTTAVLSSGATSVVRADGKVVWPWRSDAGVKLAKTLTRLADDGGNQAWSPGRSRISRKAIAQGRPDDPPVPVVLPRAFFCTRTMGAVGTRPSLRPLLSRGRAILITRALRGARTSTLGSLPRPPAQANGSRTCSPHPTLLATRE